MKFGMVLKLDHQSQADVMRSCEVLGVSRSGYYAWRDRPEADRTKENRNLVEKMKAIHTESRGT